MPRKGRWPARPTKRWCSWAEGVGLSVGGKIGIARQDDHVAVAIFFGIGLGHLDEVAVGLAHRAVS